MFGQLGALTEKQISFQYGNYPISVVEISFPSSSLIIVKSWDLGVHSVVKVGYRNTLGLIFLISRIYANSHRWKNVQNI